MYPEFHKDCSQCEAEKRQRAKEAKATPSITVGTQVRLTGVVTTSTNEQCWVSVFGADIGQEGVLIFYEPFEFIEVIRQPFKRGEVVYRDNSKYVVVEDEKEGSVKLTSALVGAEVHLAVAADYERRPSRPKEER